MKLITIVFANAAVLLATACSATEPPALPQERGSHSLLIQGYNYTDQYIDNFTVNGVGGGNVHVSGLTGGGGGSTCCHRFDMRHPSSVAIRWTANYCSYTTTNKYGETQTWRKGMWREDIVPVVVLESNQPQALEVHFYPDGHVEAAVTSGHSLPRLKLPLNVDKQRPGVSHSYPICNDEHPKQVP